MKQLSVRLIGSLCVAAGSLAVALPAKADFGSTVACDDSVRTINNVFYEFCIGPKVGDPLTGGKTLMGDADVPEIIGLFASKGYIVDPTLKYRGKSNDSSSGPFSANPGVPSGDLVFDNRIFGQFVIGLQGGAQGSENYSYYLFNNGTVGTQSLQYDTQGLINSGTVPGGPLTFAALYTPQGAQGGTVPEPAGVALAAAAFGALALTTRRRRG